uniref:Uncharacterized protein n=1 Tax=Oryza barthii TaxID=65489 RepID=A0A0D3EIU6_9ORYZ
MASYRLLVILVFSALVPLAAGDTYPAHHRLSATALHAVFRLLVPAAVILVFQHAAVVVVVLELPTAGRRWRRRRFQLPGAASAQPHRAVVPLVLQVAAVVAGDGGDGAGAFAACLGGRGNSCCCCFNYRVLM